MYGDRTLFIVILRDSDRLLYKLSFKHTDSEAEKHTHSFSIASFIGSFIS